jgi:hypothetical protein
VIPVLAISKNIFFNKPVYHEVPMPIMKIRGGDLDLVEYELRLLCQEQISRPWDTRNGSINLPQSKGL